MNNLDALLNVTKPAEPLKKNNLATLMAATKDETKPEEASLDELANGLNQMTGQIVGPGSTPAPTNTTNTPDNWEILQSELRSLRHQSGMTQRQLAHKVGCSQGTITRAENNGWISLGTLIRIAEGLGCKVHVN